MAVQRVGRQDDDHLLDMMATSRLEHSKDEAEGAAVRDRWAVLRRQQREVVDLPRPPQRHELGQAVAAGVKRADAQFAGHAGRDGGASVGQVGEGSGRQVVHDIDRLTLGDQPVDEMRTDESGATDDEDTTTVLLRLGLVVRAHCHALVNRKGLGRRGAVHDRQSWRQRRRRCD